MTGSPYADTIMLTDKHIGGPNGTITRVVIHGTVSPCERGGARANARYFQSPAAGGAAHYVVDPGEVVQCVDEDREAFHAPPNHGSIGVELCDPQQGDPERWNDKDHLAMLAKAGPLVADICARRSVPEVYIVTADLLAGAWGITGHVNVAQAWHKSDHTDPRDLPIDLLMSFVVPSTPPATENDMTPYACKTSDGVYRAFAPKKDGTIWETTYGTKWEGPVQVMNGADAAECSGGIGGSCEGLRVDLYVIGKNGVQYHGYRVEPTQPWKWEDLRGNYS